MEGKKCGKGKKASKNVAKSRMGASIKELTGRKGTRKERGDVDDRESKEQGGSGRLERKQFRNTFKK